MQKYRGEALEREFCDIAQSLGSDPEGVARGNAYLSSTHLVNRDGRVAWALTPAVFDDAEIADAAELAEAMGRIMDKVTVRYLKDADFRARFGVSPQVEALTLAPTGYDQLIPFARLDAFLSAEGEVRFCGVTTDGSTGMTATVEVTRAIQRTETYRRFSERHREIETFDISQGVVDALRETYRGWANSDASIYHPDHPAVGIVDYPESANPEEFADLIQRMADEGVYARIVDIRSLRIEEAGGHRHLVDDEGPINCVYRRALTEELVEKPCEGADALVEAGRRGLACVIGGFCSWPVATNAFLAYLTSPDAAELLDPHELAFVRAHVQPTYLLSPDSDLSAYADRSRWVARPGGRYNASDAVMGSSCASDEDWRRVLAACAQDGGAVQAFVPVSSRPVIVGGGPNGPSAEPTMATSLLGLYLFRGRFSGVFARCGYKGATSEWGQHLTMGCLVVHE